MRPTATANAAVETDYCPAFSNARPYQAAYGDWELDHINAWLQVSDFGGQNNPSHASESIVPTDARDTVTHTTTLAADLNGLLAELFSFAGHH